MNCFNSEKLLFILELQRSCRMARDVVDLALSGASIYRRFLQGGGSRLPRIITLGLSTSSLFKSLLMMAWPVRRHICVHLVVYLHFDNGDFRIFISSFLSF